MIFLLNGLLTFAVVIAVARLFGYLFQKINQPSVMGEVLGGIILGPSVVGEFFPEASAYLFSSETLGFLKVVANLGIVLYLFIMGLELNLTRLEKSARSAVIISQSSIFLPFVLGILLATYLYKSYAPPNIGFLGFSLFIGVSLSITAFPVLARILEESPLKGSVIGDLALTCAAIDDITAWCLVAVITSITAANGDSWWIPVLLTPLYIFVIFWVLRPFMRRLSAQLHRASPYTSKLFLGLAILGAMASAAITDWIGLHAFIGAFLFGAIIPHNSTPAKEAYGGLQRYVSIFLLPAFFALTGLKTQISLVSGSTEILVCTIIIVLAIFGKMAGAFIGGVLSKESKFDSLTLGILMNTRGLVELIVLNLGLAIGVLTPTLFTMFVIMAIITTFMTGPLLRLHLKISN